jgi:hypothetical protein
MGNLVEHHNYTLWLDLLHIPLVIENQFEVGYWIVNMISSH